MESAKKLSDSILETVGRKQFVRFAAWYSVLIGFFSLCVAPFLGAIGGLVLLSSAVIDSQTQMARGTELDALLTESVTDMAGIGAFTGALSIVLAVAGLLLIIVGIGLFRHSSWAHRGFIIVGSIELSISILLLLTGGDFWLLISVLISAVFIFIFVVDDEIKEVFNPRSAPAG